MDRKNGYGGLNTLSGSACKAGWQAMLWQTEALSPHEISWSSIIFRKNVSVFQLCTMKNTEFTAPDTYAEKICIIYYAFSLGFQAWR